MKKKYVLLLIIGLIPLGLIAQEISEERLLTTFKATAGYTVVIPEEYVRHRYRENLSDSIPFQFSVRGEEIVPFDLDMKGAYHIRVDLKNLGKKNISHRMI